MDEIKLKEEAAKDELRSGATADAAVPPGATRFPCKNCGGGLVFMPGTTHLVCPYCGTENDIPLEAANDDHLVEHDFLSALEAENTRQADDPETPTQDVVRCSFCGAETTVNERKTSDLCPYCGHPLAMQNLFKMKLNVQALLPFAIDAEKALQMYRNWLKSRWFAPNDFTHRATRDEAMKGCYMPYWTYDSRTTTQYRGQRGDAYYVTQTVPVTRNGKTVMQTRQVRQIRWSPAAGTVMVNFDDVLVPASKSVPVNIQDGLAPWDMGKLLPFRREFLSGFVTETYQVSLKDGFAEAETRMASAIDGAINRDIGGDEQRIDAKQTRHDDVTFKHILLPVWLSAYAYGGETYRFTINAQNGQVSGDRPYSYWKIGLAVVAGLAAVAAFAFLTGS